MTEPYQNLANAIILMAVKDYRDALKKLKKRPKYGHTKDDEGHLIIEPTEAEVVKRIYLEYLQGASLKQIGESLESDGILTAAGKARWRPETIKKILKNDNGRNDFLC